MVSALFSNGRAIGWDFIKNPGIIKLRNIKIYWVLINFFIFINVIRYIRYWTVKVVY